MSAGMFLCDSTRFKLNFSARGNVDCLWSYAKELQGRWVALVPAEDDAHIAMAAERDRLKAANAELAEALQSCIDYGTTPGSAWVFKKARAALANHQKEKA